MTAARQAALTSGNITAVRGPQQDRPQGDNHEQGMQPTTSEAAAMQTRQSDHANGNAVKITREIPLWGILTVIGTLGAQGVNTYFGQQRLAENMDRLTAQVERMTIEVNSMNRTQLGMEVRVQELLRRVEQVEAQQRVIAIGVPRR